MTYLDHRKDSGCIPYLFIYLLIHLLSINLFIHSLQPEITTQPHPFFLPNGTGSINFHQRKRGCSKKKYTVSFNTLWPGKTLSITASPQRYSWKFPLCPSILLSYYFEDWRAIAFGNKFINAILLTLRPMNYTQFVYGSILLSFMTGEIHPHVSGLLHW